jgi:hypothetical protein
MQVLYAVIIKGGQDIRLFTTPQEQEKCYKALQALHPGWKRLGLMTCGVEEYYK